MVMSPCIYSNGIAAQNLKRRSKHGLVYTIALSETNILYYNIWRYKSEKKSAHDKLRWFKRWHLPVDGGHR